MQFLPSAAPADVGLCPLRAQRLLDALQSDIDRQRLPGAVVLVARRGRVALFEHLGRLDPVSGAAMTRDAIFRIYSMTKPIVSTALMLLHEEGRFQLEHPVAQYLPAFATTKVLAADGALVDQARPMQVRELLMHTSGLTYDFMADNPVAQLYRDARIMNDATRTLAALVDDLAALPLAFQPGTRWHYSVGIDVAARLIEVLAGQSVGDFLQERLFDPLGMVDTGFAVPADQLHRLSAMYGLPDLIGENYSAIQLVEAALAGFNERLDVSATYPTDTPHVFQRGGVGLFSTAADYMRFGQMLAAGGTLDGVRVVGRKTLELMHANHLPVGLLPYELMGLPNPGMGFGLGSRVMLDVAATAGPGSAGEYGWAGAAKTYYWVDPAEDLVGLFMSQNMTGMQLAERDFRSLVYQAIDD